MFSSDSKPYSEFNAKTDKNLLLEHILNSIGTSEKPGKKLWLYQASLDFTEDAFQKNLGNGMPSLQFL
jgi:hypothetical protein